MYLYTRLLFKLIIFLQKKKLKLNKALRKTVSTHLLKIYLNFETILTKWINVSQKNNKNNMRSQIITKESMVTTLYPVIKLKWKYKLNHRVYNKHSTTNINRLVKDRYIIITIIVHKSRMIASQEH